MKKIIFGIIYLILDILALIGIVVGIYNLGKEELFWWQLLLIGIVSGMALFIIILYISFILFYLFITLEEIDEKKK